MNLGCDTQILYGFPHSLGMRVPVLCTTTTPGGTYPVYGVHSNNTTNNDNTYEVTVCARCHRGDPADLVPWGKYLYPVYVLLLLTTTTTTTMYVVIATYYVYINTFVYTYFQVLSPYYLRRSELPTTSRANHHASISTHFPGKITQNCRYRCCVIAVSLLVTTYVSI